MEALFLFLEKHLNVLNGFLMAGVILILVGIKNVTLKELHEYRLSHTNVKKIDEIIAWGIFYIIFGVLIAAGAIVTIYF